MYLLLLGPLCFLMTHIGLDAGECGEVFSIFDISVKIGIDLHCG